MSKKTTRRRTTKRKAGAVFILGRGFWDAAKELKAEDDEKRYGKMRAPPKVPKSTKQLAKRGFGFMDILRDPVGAAGRAASSAVKSHFDRADAIKGMTKEQIYAYDEAQHKAKQERDTAEVMARINKPRSFAQNMGVAMSGNPFFGWGKPRKSPKRKSRK